MFQGVYTCECAVDDHSTGLGFYSRLTVCPHFLSSSSVLDEREKAGDGWVVSGGVPSHPEITLRAHGTPAKEQLPQGHVYAGPQGL